MMWVVKREFQVFYFPEYLLTLLYVLPAYLAASDRDSRKALLDLCHLRYTCTWMKTLAAELGAGLAEPNPMSRTRDRLAYRIERLDGFLESLY